MDVVEQVKSLVMPEYDKLGCWVHGWAHIERVYNNSQELADLESVNRINCGIAAYCHDLGRVEEERLKKERGASPPHSLLSIRPTNKILNQLGISGKDYDDIGWAVAIHSDWDYPGENGVAKILQDADKIGGFGPFGVLSNIKFFGGEDYVDCKEIVQNRHDSKSIQELCNYSLELLNDKEVIEKVIRGLDFVLEWRDRIHTDSARRILEPLYEYHMQVKHYLETKSVKI